MRLSSTIRSSRAGPTEQPGSNSPRGPRRPGSLCNTGYRRFLDAEITAAELPKSEQVEVAAGCYELLLVLAEVETTPDQGLRAWTRRLGCVPPPWPTTSGGLRAWPGWARTGGRARTRRGRTSEGDDGVRSFPGRAERYEQEDSNAAIPHFYAALELQPDHFWAQCLRAISRCSSIGPWRRRRA